jgi:transcriptional regulator with XRE-family HTH domain
VSNPRSAASIDINGPAVRALRMAKGVGITPFAARLGCHRSYVSGIEVGNAARVSPEMFAKLVAALALEDDRAIRLHPYGGAQ